MNPVRRAAFDHEIALAKERVAQREFEAGLTHLERAHVLGQAFVLPHARSHWLMLQVELRRNRLGAAFGQVVRIGLGLIGSAVGVVPIGNTGGSDVSMFERMPIDPELQHLIDGRQRPDARSQRSS
jgi:hypothetical protein